MLIRVLVWRKLDRCKGDRNRYLINYMATTQGRWMPEERGQKSQSASAATSLRLDRKVASLNPEDDVRLSPSNLALICNLLEPIIVTCVSLCNS